MHGLFLNFVWHEDLVYEKLIFVGFEWQRGYNGGKEVFLYYDINSAPQPQTPPEFTQNYLWKMVNIQSEAYKTAQTIGFHGNLFNIAGWPAAASYQW